MAALASPSPVVYKLSPQQEAVLNFGDDSQGGNLNLIARAGCGKSSTLKALVLHVRDARLSNTRGIWMGSFSKDITTVLKNWLTSENIDYRVAVASTLHSTGFKAWMKIAPGVIVEKDKLAMLFDFIWPEKEQGRTDEPFKSQRQYRAFAVKACSLAKQRAFGVLCSISDESKWFDMVDHFGLDEDLEEGQEVGRGIELAVRLYRQSLDECRKCIDMDDMILAPLFFRARFWTYSWVLIDEAQDLNPARRALCKAILAPGGRLIAVGDPAQAIFGFTGADSDSLDILRAEMSSRELPLNVTYRCGKTIVAQAQRFVPDIEAHSSAPDGVHRVIDMKEFRLEKLLPTDAILCRKSAPLLETAYGLLKRGVACKVEGRKIGEGLIALINRFKVVKLGTLVTKVEEHRDRETAKWLAKGKEDRAANIADACETVAILSQQLLAEGKSDVSHLVTFLSNMFQDTGYVDGETGVQVDGPAASVLTLSTIHKSKGREWDRVFILGANLYQPSRYARKEWQLQQEDNLSYVAITRAKSELIDILVSEEPTREK